MDNSQIKEPLSLHHTFNGKTQETIISYLPSSVETIYTDPIKMALVVTTYGSVPYVHLGLEAVRVNNIKIPILVVDDHSPHQNELKELCKKYAAHFATTSGRQGFPMGDLTGILSGLFWAECIGADLLVKFSRRFIPTYDWTCKLEEIALKSQSATFSNICQNLNWGFRTECLGLHVNSWYSQYVMSAIVNECLAKDKTFVEGYIHTLAKHIALQSCKANIEYNKTIIRMPDAGGYEPWDIMGTNRTVKYEDLLWHHSCSPQDYYVQSKQYGLPYTLYDFSESKLG